MTANPTGVHRAPPVGDHRLSPMREARVASSVGEFLFSQRGRRGGFVGRWCHSLNIVDPQPMRVLPPPVPPELPIAVSWRDLWRSGAFAQLDLTWATNFATRAGERELHVGAGPGPFEELDLAGAFQPIAFAAGGNPPNLVDMTPYEENMTFREEQGAQPWSTYAWEQHGHSQTTALYSPWQFLYLDHVIERSGERLSLAQLLGAADELASMIDRLRWLLEKLQASWASLHENWQPLMKLLVALQNRYLPAVTGSSTFLLDAEQGIRVEPWERELETFDPQATAQRLSVSVEQVQGAYWFLVERGIKREPRDEMEWLRRARPRAARQRWRGPARLAQDHFDAAQMLRLFLRDLTGEPPPRPTALPMDGRQRFREALYDRGPVPYLTRDDLIHELIATELYPHAVHVVGEGKSEYEFVTTLVSGMLGDEAADEVGFSDLGGSGSASRLPTMVDGFTTYAQRTVVIVDSEGQMAEYTTGLERSGNLPSEDVLRFAANIEDCNFTAQEQIDVLTDLAANPEGDLLPVELRITERDLEDEYAKRAAKADESPGRAGVLLDLATDPNYGGPVQPGKPEFARALARRMLDELDAASGEEEREALLDRRPLLRFTMDRIVPPLTAPRFR